MLPLSSSLSMVGVTRVRSFHCLVVVMCLSHESRCYEIRLHHRHHLFVLYNVRHWILRFTNDSMNLSTTERTYLWFVIPVHWKNFVIWRRRESTLHGLLFSVPVVFLKPDTHYSYIRVVYTGRTYGCHYRHTGHVVHGHQCCRRCKNGKCDVTVNTE